MASVKSNLIHRVLEVLSKGDEYDFNDESIAIKLNENRRWYEKLRKKEYSIHQANYAINTLFKDIGDDAILITSGKHGDSWMIKGNTGIKRIRGCLASGEYKEELKWWVWPARLLSGLVGIATIIGVVDNRQAPALHGKITQQETRIESLRQRIARDSIVLDSIRDLIETVKKQKSDSLEVKH
jgi:hypothetical protein